jgi:hypothetical protein
MKQRQQFGGSAANILVRLTRGLSFWLPGRAWMRDRLVGTGFILVPDGDPVLLGQKVRLLDQPLFRSASGS